MDTPYIFIKQSDLEEHRRTIELHTNEYSKEFKKLKEEQKQAWQNLEFMLNSNPIVLPEATYLMFKSFETTSEWKHFEKVIDKLNINYIVHYR